jgi:plasmid stabilization system protein ParE
MNIIWTPLASHRLEEIFDFIALDSKANAEKYIEDIISKIELLVDYPNLGRVVPELNIEYYREIIIGNYRIIYKTSQDNIFILTIRHSRRLFDLSEVK